MRACIHRGSKQIGGSCVEIESQGKRLVIDLGLPLDANANTCEYLPRIKGLDGSDSNLLGILVSHPHLDHFGLLKHVSHQIPVGLGKSARKVLNAAAPFMPENCSVTEKGWDYQPNQPFDIGPFRITPFLVDHSAYDAYSLLIESEGKRLLYSGDFRSHGRKGKLFHSLIMKPPGRINTLLLEGSSLGRLGVGKQFPTEKDLESKFGTAFSSAEGLALVHTSSQNIDRIVSIYKASKKTGRTLIIDLYTAIILEATGNKHIPKSFWPDIALFVPYLQRLQIKKNAWFDKLGRHSSNRIYAENIRQSPSTFTLVFRPLHQFDLKNCLEGALYIYSQWEGYWEQNAYRTLKSWLKKHDVPKLSIHTSGHASPGDLKKFAKAVSPEKLVPIHSFQPQSYLELFSNVKMYNDGQWWEV